MRTKTQRAIEAALGTGVRIAKPVAGGDVSEAYALELTDGRRAFAKTRLRAPPGMFQAEARGLAWLRSAFESPRADPKEVVRIPDVLAVADDGKEPLLVLELLEPGPRRADFDEQLGRGLAFLHRSGAPGFGFHEDNFIGPLLQSNRSNPTWAEFYREERLLAQLDLPSARRLLPRGLRQRFERLLVRLSDLVGPSEPPARLHGDLWGGNLHGTADGRPALIDPAVYGGHREMDLAMMRLFGGFSERVFSAYAEAYPLLPGHAERLRLWQLYPLLVHVNLFGSSYVEQVGRALDPYVA